MKNEKEIEHLKAETQQTKDKMVEIINKILTHKLGAKDKFETPSKVDITYKDQVLNKTKDTDKREFYKSKGMDEENVAQLMSMDLEILRLFEIQLKKNTKNDEMLANKINTLNQRPNLIPFLFKKGSFDELSKEIYEIEE